MAARLRVGRDRAVVRGCAARPRVLVGHHRRRRPAPAAQRRRHRRPGDSRRTRRGRAVRRRDDHGDARERTAAGGARGHPCPARAGSARRAGTRTARRRAGGAVVEIPVDEVAVGDRLLVGTGQVVPVDGRLLGPATLDESALTGEPLPVDRPAGDDVRSGVVNSGPPADLVATSVAADSTYAGVVRLVEQAQASSAPFVRTADRFALLFVPFTLALAGAAWAWAGDPVRAVAVLVVATPCPLLLAAPIAIMSGLSRAAGIGVVIKGGGALERLAGGRVMLFDKTGTLTQGHPVLAGVVTADEERDADEVLRLAASLDQVSAHVLASAIVTGGARRGRRWSCRRTSRRCTATASEAGWVPTAWRWARRRGSSVTRRRGGSGRCGAARTSTARSPSSPRSTTSPRARSCSRTRSDPTRPAWCGRSAPRASRGGSGHRGPVGHRRDGGSRGGRRHGARRVRPRGQVRRHRARVRERADHHGRDGINERPALAAAGVGVALASRGATASSEAADVVLTVDRVDALADAILIARRSKAIALQAVRWAWASRSPRWSSRRRASCRPRSARSPRR